MIMIPLSDLFPGNVYTVYISSENCITDLVSENQTAIITASIETSTLDGKKQITLSLVGIQYQFEDNKL